MELNGLRAAIIGLSGLRLTDAEHDVLRRSPPAGIILFGRNIRDRDQLAALMAELHEILPPGTVRMVDQEGGRVARLRPPQFRAHPPCGRLRTERAAWIQGALIGAEAASVGFDVVCAPVLDVRHDGASGVVGDRAFSDDPATVARLGAAMAAGLLAAGVQPVAKHAPGHGRAVTDSHQALPRVAGLLESDLIPFAAAVDLPWWMTAHVVYDGVDTQPATISARIVTEVIRGRLGFTGILVSDDLAMHALNGAPEDRARAAWAAGCDLALYCPGDAATADVLAAAPMVSDALRTRMEGACALALRSRQILDIPALTAERDAILAVAA